MSSLERRIARLERTNRVPEDFHFILVEEDPMVYEGSDGRRYSLDALLSKLKALGDEPGPISVYWDLAGTPLEPEPDAVYITWGECE